MPSTVGPVSPVQIPSAQPLGHDTLSLNGKPPPYTSLPPPIISIPLTPAPTNGLSGIPMVDHARNDNVRAVDEATMNDGDRVTHTSWRGTSSSAASFGTGPNMSKSVALRASRPSLENSIPRSRSFHHDHSQYPGPVKPNSGRNTSLRRRIFAVVGNVSSSRSGRAGNGVETEGEGESEWESEGRAICTTPGMACAGETETETDEPSRHLPTARLPKASSRLSTSFSLLQSNSFTTLQWQWLLFEFSRLLAIVPASLGFIWCLWNTYAFVPHADRCTGPGRPLPDRIDYTVASLWALLTAHQCLSLTTGLLTRWRHYYTPLSTLVRLLALQGICWPATHLTVNIFEAAKRPAVVWALIGTTTCTSRSIQIWVVSNLPTNSASSQGISSGAIVDARERDKRRAPEAEGGKPFRGYGYVYWKKWNKWRRKRRWDWREVSIKCVLPAGVLYFVMAWAGEMRRELGRC